jgi:hypothetical protein
MYLRDVQSQPAKKRQLRQVKLFEIIDHHGPRHVMGINATWAHHRSMRLMFCLFCFYAGLEQWTWWSHVESEHIRWSDFDATQMEPRDSPPAPLTASDPSLMLSQDLVVAADCCVPSKPSRRVGALPAMQKTQPNLRNLAQPPCPF